WCGTGGRAVPALPQTGLHWHRNHRVPHGGQHHRLHPLQHRWLVMPQFDLPLSVLRAYRPDVAEPADFDEFWQRTLDESRAAGGEVTLELVHALPGVEIFDMTFPGFGGQPIKAWYSRPANTSAALPVVVQFHGYGGGRGLPFEHTFWPSAGYAHVMMDNRGQGSSWGNGGDTPDVGSTGPSLPGEMTRG